MQRRRKRPRLEPHVEEVEAPGPRHGGFQRLRELRPRAHEVAGPAERIRDPRRGDVAPVVYAQGFLTELRAVMR